MVSWIKVLIGGAMVIGAVAEPTPFGEMLLPFGLALLFGSPDQKKLGTTK